MKKFLALPVCLDAAYWTFMGVLISVLFGTHMPSSGGLFRVASIAVTGTMISGLIRLADRRLFRGKVPDRTEALFYAAASLVGALIWLAVDVLMYSSLFREIFQRGLLPGALLTNVIFDGTPLFVWSFVRFTIRLILRGKEDEVRLSRASALARGAQRRMLRDQLNPHFLFNALNSILALIDEDPAKARQMTLELEEFLRYALAEGRSETVPFRCEWEATKLYFAIQKTRYEDRLEVLYDINPNCLDRPIPGFLLHPLAENAVKFGMKTSPMPLRIRIEARVEGDRFRLKVANTGSWFSADPAHADGPPGTSTGLANIRMRLANSYPGQHAFEIGEKDGWVEARLEILAKERPQP